MTDKFTVVTATINIQIWLDKDEHVADGVREVIARLNNDELDEFGGCLQQWHVLPCCPCYLRFGNVDITVQVKRNHSGSIFSAPSD